MSLALSVFNHLIDTVGNVVDATYSVVMGSWPGLTIVFLYTVIVGYTVLMGRAGEKSKDWAISAFLLSVLGGIAASPGAYSEWVGGPIYDLAYNLASVGTGSGSGSGVGGMFDTMESAVGRTLTTIDAINVPGNIITNAWLYIKVAAASFILALLALALYLATLALFCIAFFSLFMMLIAGGPCLWLASFKETRHITKAWLKQTLNYCIWIFYLGVVAGIGVEFVSAAVDDLTRWDLENDGVFTKDLGNSMLFMALTTYMLLKATDWAAALTGGTATNTGVIGAMGGAAGGAMGGAMNALGGAAGSAVKWGAGAIANKTSMGNAAYRAYSAIKGIGKVK